MLLLCVCCQAQFFLIPWTVACQEPLMGFFRQEYWSELPFSPPGDLPDPGIKPVVSCVSCVAGEILTSEPSGRWQFNNYTLQYLKVEPWKNLKLLFLYYSIISNHEPILIALLNKENNYRRYAHLKTFISCQLYCKFMTRLQIYSTVNHRILH